MKCPSCGHVSFGREAACGNCGARAGSLDDAFELSEADLDAQARPVQPAAAFLLQPHFLRDAGEQAVPPELPPVIDSPEEIPDRFWAPEGAGLVRRAGALALDLALLAALLGLFAAGASLALARAGIGASALLSGAGLEAALLPLALLAALLSFAYHVGFDALAGRTPGKRLAGLEVRSADGSAPTWGRAALRWCGGALGLACAGVGIAWALLEPRRRGWADLLSKTVVAAPLPEDGARPR